MASISRFPLNYSLVTIYGIEGIKGDSVCIKVLATEQY